VIIVDLDRLKATNDAEGHAAGDALLRRAGAALVAQSRTTDVVARVGGDEFALLAVDTDLPTARILAARLAEALAGERVEASLGLAERIPATGLAGAWVEADRRMYTAKRRRAGLEPAGNHTDA
jgi:diguanylate cyclase (GGDEF)-like protein